MGAAFFPVFFFTMVWGGVGIALPRMVPNGPNQSLACYSFSYTLQMLGILPGSPVKQVAYAETDQALCCRLLQVVLMITGAVCWLFWLCCYMAQMNPLIGPRLSNRTLLLIAQQWGNPLERF